MPDLRMIRRGYGVTAVEALHGEPWPCCAIGFTPNGGLYPADQHVIILR